MEHAIDLLILLLYTLHILQPLNISVFSLLKRALAIETNTASRLNAGYITVVNRRTCIYVQERLLYDH